MPNLRAWSGRLPTALFATLLAGSTPAAPAEIGGAVLTPVPFEALPGFPGPDPAAALEAFRRVCAAPTPPTPQPAGVAGDPAALSAACAAAADIAPEAAEAFFRQRFDAFRVVRPGAERPGFLTGYFEPELEGVLSQGPVFPTPVLARPSDLVSLAPGETRPGLDPALRAARATAEGFAPYPDRAAIEDGALGAQARPILWLRDAVDLLVLQVQGSGRVRLPDGRAVRVLYDGRNGQPYTAVAKLIVQEGHLPLEGLTLARWTTWLRAHPETARRLIRANASYIFFRLAPVEDPALGPPGAANAPLTPGRSLAVDGGLWRYGLPFWLVGQLPGAAPGEAGRLVIAADTGSAIVGPARGDLFVGTGAQAGIAAGNLRDAVGFVVLLPKPAPGVAP
ncbi:murein transglycosylase A [Methylobacterium brachiatum]|uniref:murein transglycosylase A n=1 Tax=Methylobacterium brachiatum TaxID=269660 RepID=UPI0008ED91EE|nr:MltA domain-containing protein [Methylobacterium brachiatum]SFI03860.1 membrane-bound lytic murein transglycosylase A [Methylobacterium brachiatum]